MYFRRALTESSITVANNLTIDHEKGMCKNGDIEYPVVFPLNMIKTVQDIANKNSKTTKYFYRGILTPKKEWILEFKNRKDTVIEFSNYGRDNTKKQNLDLDYYKKMSSSYFTFCPTDIYHWSYRFFESVMCNSIPIVDDNVEDIFSHRFRFYKKSDNHIFHKEWTEYNIKQLKIFHTVKKNLLTLPYYQLSLDKEFDFSPQNVGKLIQNTNSTVHENISVSSVDYTKGKWHSIICVDNNSSKIITKCNHFFDSFNRQSRYQKNDHQIYRRMIYTYYYITNSTSDVQTVINEESLLIANTFTGLNSGHELSIILDCVAYLRQNKSITHIVLFRPRSKWVKNNSKLLHLLLENTNVNIIFIDFSHVYVFKKIHILRNEFMNIMKHGSLISELHNKLIKSSNMVDKNLLNRKVILLKCHRNNDVMRRDTSLICEKLLNTLEKEHDFVFINPEKYDIIELANILMTATRIVSGWGGILYTNMMFFNKRAKITLVKMNFDRANHYWTYITSKANMIIDITDNNLDKNINEHKRVYSNILHY